MNQSQTRLSTEGLVIKTMSVGESDRLVTLFTREYGLIKAFASGAKNIKSKKGAATSLLTYSSFQLSRKKGTFRITEAVPIAQFFCLSSDIETLSLSQYFCELCNTFAEENVPNTQLLRLILNSLHFITKDKKYPPLIKAITELRIASISGYAPNLVACEDCSRFEDDTMYFDLHNACLYCSDCKPEGIFSRLDRTTLSAMRHIVYSDFSRLYAFEIPKKSADCLSKITERYLTLQTDYRFETLDFYNHNITENTTADSSAKE